MGGRTYGFSVKLLIAIIACRMIRGPTEDKISFEVHLVERYVTGHLMQQIRRSVWLRQVKSP
jgi:hypothetical protein